VRYQGYDAKVTFDPDAEVVDGEVIGLRDVITGDRRDHRVVASCPRLAARAAERRGDATERAGGTVVEREASEPAATAPR
jgi:hypothetical protein